MITRVLRNAIWLGTGEAAVKGGLLLVAVIIARGSGPEGVGTFSIAYAAALIGIMLVACGQQEVLIREVARAPGHARILLDQAQRVQRRMALWLFPAAGIVLLVVPDSQLGLALMAFVPYVVLRTATVTRGATFKGMDRMDVEVGARGIEIVVALICIAAAAYLAWPVWMVGVAFSLGAALGLVWISRRDWGVAQDEGAFTAVAVARQGLPFMVLAVLGQLLVNTDRFLLEIHGIARSEIGFWAAAGTVVWALIAVPQLVSVAVYPSISRIASEGGTWRRVGVAMFSGGAVLGTACALALRESAAPVIGLLFGSEFAPAVALMERLSLVLPGAFAMMALGAVYAAWRRQHLAMGILAGAFCLSVVLNVLWIPVLGAMACANAAVVSYSAAALVQLVGLAAPVRSGELPG